LPALERHCVRRRFGEQASARARKATGRAPELLQAFDLSSAGGMAQAGKTEPSLRLAAWRGGDGLRPFIWQGAGLVHF